MKAVKQWQNKAPDVLIVGAGPTGLMMACQLALRGIAFRIVDKKDIPTYSSGALFIQARSVELFNQMGIAQTAIHQGVIAGEIKLLFQGKKTFRIPIDNLGQGLSKFPYLLMLEQSKTEQILTDFIGNCGYAVERNTELLSFRQDDECVTAILKLPDGEKENLKTSYIIAADGGRSTIREQLALPFLGSTHPVPLFVSDCSAEMPSDAICFTFTNTATTGFFPLTEGRWRIDGTLPDEVKTQGSLTFGDIAENFAERTRIKVELHTPQWFSVFHSHEGYAASFQQNRCFLIGDAAHLLSPVGAQGMNTGLQDACNLAWKLALVIQHKSKESLLNTYSPERITIVKNAISSTEKVFRWITSQHCIIKSFRVYIVPLILKLFLPVILRQKFIRQTFFENISEIGVHYRGSPLSYNASLGNFPDFAPKPGDRLPFIEYNDGAGSVNLQEKVKGTGFHLLIFTKGMSFIEIQKVAAKYARVLTMELILFSNETVYLFKRLGLENSGCYLIRPDMYIAYRSVIPEAGHFEQYLQRFLLE